MAVFYSSIKHYKLSGAEGEEDIRDSQEPFWTILHRMTIIVSLIIVQKVLSNYMELRGGKRTL